MKRLILPLFIPLALAANEPARDDPGALAAAGNIAWRSGDKGAAVLNWERAVMLSPDQSAARAGLALAKESGVKSPAPSPVERYSAALPSRGWLAVMTGALHTGATLLLLAYLFPGLRRRATYAGAGCAASLTLLSIPGIIGKVSEVRRAVIMKPETVLRLTPTSRGENTGARVSAGDSVRITGRENGFRHVRTSDGAEGWVLESEATPVPR
jgi:uncharacterized protein YgiM (DUF1202 family)